MFSNPIFKKLSYFTIYLLVWLIVSAAYFGMLLWRSDLNFNVALLDSLIFNILLCGLGISFWYSAKFIPIESNSLYKIFLIHAAGGIIASSIWLFTGFNFIKEFNVDKLYINYFFSTLNWRFLIGLLFYFLITSFYYVLIYYFNFQERTSAENELKSLVSEAELRMLKFQINPHFIFNSLNSISALTVINPAKAQQMVIKLADYLRGTLAENEKKISPLENELKNVKLYLDIEKIRFENKFIFTEDVKSECLKKDIPAMILQPVVENAVKHAVYEAIETIEIKLSCCIVNNFLKISIQNNFENSISPAKGTGIGLSNIKKRLKLFYGNPSLLEIKTEENLFIVNIFIPLDEK